MEFIGQSELIKNLKGTNARAILVQGPRHFGKKTLIRQIYKELGLYVYEVSGSVADFRATIDFIKTQAGAIMYLIPDVDRLSPGIQNLLLKILEEPPMKSRFCLTASNSILPTIKSRCVCYSMEPYTKEQIHGWLCDSEAQLYSRYSNLFDNCVSSPGQAGIMLDWASIESTAGSEEHMPEIQPILKDSLALVLNRANLLCRYLKDKNLDYYVFYLIAKAKYSQYESFGILTRYFNELDRYVLCYFYSELWKEAACK